ncbi:MAG: lipoyl synthase [Candidatus Omnitrophota bacterium]
MNSLQVSQILSQLGVATVCRQAQCPNIARCFLEGQATFMILGSTCTRQCRFCAVDKSDTRALSVDEGEPLRIREAVRLLNLSYVVITSVARDDLPDAGASSFARTIEAVRSLNKDIKIEVLIPDFQGKALSLKRVLDAGPDVLAHNLETVERLYADVRPQANYRLSLRLLRQAKETYPGILTKSSLMLGLGETKEELIAALQDLQKCGCDILTLGQYLAPSKKHHPVQEFISKEQFKEYEEMALSLGFKAVLAGSLVRSSYRAEEVYHSVLRPCMT